VSDRHEEHVGRRCLVKDDSSSSIATSTGAGERVRPPAIPMDGTQGATVYAFFLTPALSEELRYKTIR